MHLPVLQVSQSENKSMNRTASRVCWTRLSLLLFLNSFWTHVELIQWSPLNHLLLLGFISRRGPQTSIKGSWCRCRSELFLHRASFAETEIFEGRPSDMMNVPYDGSGMFRPAKVEYGASTYKDIHFVTPDSFFSPVPLWTVSNPALEVWSLYWCWQLSCRSSLNSSTMESPFWYENLELWVLDNCHLSPFKARQIESCFVFRESKFLAWGQVKEQ